jgi:dTDP-glucose 4,6-dehydratase
MWTIEHDLDDVVARCSAIWPKMAGSRIFITGGTGFIGCWLLETLRRANRHGGFAIEATILTRSSANFKAKAPHLFEDPLFNFVEGNILSLDSIEGEYPFVIHAATDASAHLIKIDPLKMFTTVINGTEHALEFALKKNAKRVLYLSSGAVYGQQPWDMLHVSEEFFGGPNCVDPRSTYAEAKRAAEMLCAIYKKQHGMQIGIARIFALLGPYLSLDIHFAAGNFIRDAMSGKKVVVVGDGMPCRSYLYPTDLTVWLWHLLTDAESCKPYNLGSEESISIADLAKKVSNLIGSGEYEILGQEDPGWHPGRYVPDTRLIVRDFALPQTVDLGAAITRTAIWNGWGERR